MTKYYISLKADGNFHIIEYDTGEGVRVLRDAGGRETSVVIYHNSLIISALYDTVEAAIKHLGGSRRETILPDGRVVIPESVNYPELAIRNIFVPLALCVLKSGLGSLDGENNFPIRLANTNFIL